MELNDAQFRDTSRTLAAAVLTVCERRQLSTEDTTAIAGAALMEVLGQILGPFAAVERLRDLADTFERQLLDESRHGIDRDQRMC